MKKMIILVMVVLSAQFCYAALPEELNQLKDDYNNNYEAPGIVKSLFGNERINLYISDINATFKITTKKAKIIGLEEGLLEDPTLNVYTTEETIDEIADSDDPSSAFMAAIDNEDIAYKAATVGSKVRYAVAGLLSIFLKNR